MIATWLCLTGFLTVLRVGSATHAETLNLERTLSDLVNQA
jgi:hypothetical protein